MSFFRDKGEYCDVNFKWEKWKKELLSGKEKRHSRDLFKETLMQKRNIWIFS